ncbi:MAG TPA: saccharopine dehydrogenase, partial [Myxococcus sp.]|nr:saccharopine dehydrogenase [Myxococcus sp.]
APMVEAALHAGVHYVDLSGEWAAIEGVRRYGAQARQRGVMLMPAAGFDVVPSDCLALHVASRVPGARHLVIAVSGLELYSRGSVRTLGEFAGDAVRVRRNGALVTVPPGSLQRTFDFGAGPRPAYALSWADVSTAYYTTGIPNIEVYYEANPLLHANLAINRWLGALARNPFMRMGFDAFVQALPDGPSDMERAGRRAVVIAEADDGAGRLVRSRLWTPEAYGFTCTTSLAIAQRVMAGNLEPGFQTPARVYGADWILGLPGVHREDALPSASTASAPATRLT